MKTIAIRLPDVEAAMPVELQKVNRAYRPVGSSYQSNPTGICRDAQRQGVKVKKLERASNLRSYLLASIGLLFSHLFVA